MTKREFKKKAEKAFLKRNPKAVVIGWIDLRLAPGGTQYTGKFYVMAPGYSHKFYTISPGYSPKIMVTYGNASRISVRPFRTI